MRSTLLKSVAVAAFAFAATAASAETVKLEAQSGGLFGGTNVVTVQTSATTTAVNAGAFRVQDKDDTTRKFLAWCVDLANTLSLPGTYTTPASFLTETVTSNLQKLFNTAYALVDPNDAKQSAAFQLAIWEIIEETSPQAGFDLTTGDFKITHAPSNVLTAGQAFLDNLDGPAVGTVWELTFWQPHPNATSSQALVTASPIPLPAAAWMLIAALAATAAATRARRSA